MIERLDEIEVEVPRIGSESTGTDSARCGRRRAPWRCSCSRSRGLDPGPRSSGGDREMQRGRAARHGHAVPGADVVGELALERLDLGRRTIPRSLRAERRRRLPRSPRPRRLARKRGSRRLDEHLVHLVAEERTLLHRQRLKVLDHLDGVDCREQARSRHQDEVAPLGRAGCHR